ncbi:FtsJ-like methyltransferase family protein isoform 2 [Theobroma cacao]|uniref:rRNA methyltransferase 2, mitochondrial n=1 Tax=Theobroma cacao TaxID=3641 RepID=A0A061FMY3_THECC|nr:FtsJ-like methyltransferase family protein isoform 2 [Theobroma cacao]
MSGAGAPDFFYREAQRLGYVARSAFKLLQIQKQYKLIKPGSAILDLGCAPGAWLQVACQSLGPLKNGGAVVGIDLKKVKVPSLHCDSRVQTVSADVMKLPKQQVMELSPQVCEHLIWLLVELPTFQMIIFKVKESHTLLVQMIMVYCYPEGISSLSFWRARI